MMQRDPWVSGWVAAAGLALLCVGLFLQVHIARQPPSDVELAYDLLEHAFDSVVVELDSIRVLCPEQEVSP